MENIGTISFGGVLEGSKWIKNCERDPDIHEIKRFRGLFWTCDVTDIEPKMILRKFEGNVWYTFRENYNKKGWVMSFDFTHWLRQGLGIPDVPPEEIKELTDHIDFISLNYRSRLGYNI
jgi:hypothetical protein